MESVFLNHPDYGISAVNHYYAIAKSDPDAAVGLILNLRKKHKPMFMALDNIENIYSFPYYYYVTSEGRHLNVEKYAESEIQHCRRMAVELGWREEDVADLKYLLEIIKESLIFIDSGTSVNISDSVIFAEIKDY